MPAPPPQGPFPALPAELKGTDFSRGREGRRDISQGSVGFTGAVGGLVPPPAAKRLLMISNPAANTSVIIHAANGPRAPSTSVHSSSSE